METSRSHCDLLHQSHGHSAAQASVLFQVFMISTKSDMGSNGGMLSRQLQPKGHSAFRELDSSNAKLCEHLGPRVNPCYSCHLRSPSLHTCMNVALFFVGTRLKHHVLRVLSWPLTLSFTLSLCFIAFVGFCDPTHYCVHECSFSTGSRPGLFLSLLHICSI